MLPEYVVFSRVHKILIFNFICETLCHIYIQYTLLKNYHFPLMVIVIHLNYNSDEFTDCRLKSRRQPTNDRFAGARS